MLDIKDLISPELLIDIENTMSEALGFRMTILGADGKRITPTAQLSEVCSFYIENEEGHDNECRRLRKDAINSLMKDRNKKRTNELVEYFECGVKFKCFLVPIIYVDNWIGFLWGSVILSEHDIQKKFPIKLSPEKEKKFENIYSNIRPQNIKLMNNEWVPLARQTALLIANIVHEKLKRQEADKTARFLDDTLKKKGKQIKHILSLGTELSRLKTSEELFKRIMKEILLMCINAEWAAISLFDDGKYKILSLKRNSNLLKVELVQLNRIKHGDVNTCLTRWVCENQIPIKINDIKNSQFYSYFSDAKSVMISPFSGPSKNYGALGIYSTHKNCFDDEIMFMLFCYQAAVAMEVQNQFQILAERMQFVAHQVIAPIAGMKSHVENLRSGRTQEGRKKLVYNSIYYSCEQALALVRKFAFISEALKNKKVTVPLQPYNSNEIQGMLIDYAINFKSMAENKNIKISIHEASFYNFPVIFIDPNTFNQIIMLLMDNAVKYSDTYSKVDVLANITKYRAEIIFENVPIYSIEKDEIKNIFNLGFRSKGAKDLNPSGTGLGLFLVKRIMSLHKGLVEVNITPKNNFQIKLVFHYREK